ncbi:MAG: HAD family hydrolase [Dehalococcoidales bacterium]
MPEAILFDLDDTIIAYDAISGDCWQRVCSRFSARLPGLETEQLFTAINQARNWYWDDAERNRRGRLDLFKARREVVALAFENLGINDKQVGAELADSYSTEREETVSLIPGAIDTLTYFRTINRKLGLVTNGASDAQRAKIERFKLARFFHRILVEGEFGQGKPEKKVFLSILKKLETPPVDAWMVGDDLERDIAGAQAAGIYAVWVDWKGQGLPQTTRVKPDRIIREISELI